MAFVNMTLIDGKCNDFRQSSIEFDEPCINTDFWTFIAEGRALGFVLVVFASSMRFVICKYSSIVMDSMSSISLITLITFVTNLVLRKVTKAQSMWKY